MQGAGLVLEEPYQLFCTMEGGVERRMIARCMFELKSEGEKGECFFESFVDSFEWVVETSMNCVFSPDVGVAS